MELNYCYHHSDFSFSDEALGWIKETYVEPYKGKDTVVYYDKYPTSIAKTKLFNKDITWEGTKALEELREYLALWGIPKDYLGQPHVGPDVFMFNNNNYSQVGYPHIDGYMRDDKNPNLILPVLTRFNIVIEYNPDDNMYWWEDIVQGHPLVGPVLHEFKDVHGNTLTNYQLLGIKGNGAADLWSKCGTPSFTKNGLYKNHKSAFLRTDCAHCVNISKPGFRLVVATALNKSLEELYRYRGYI